MIRSPVLKENIPLWVVSITTGGAAAVAEAVTEMPEHSGLAIALALFIAEILIVTPLLLKL